MVATAVASAAVEEVVTAVAFGAAGAEDAVSPHTPAW